MTTFIKAKLKQSNDQTNIDKYRVAANIIEYHIISKFIFLRIINPKNVKKSTCLIRTYGLFCYNYRVFRLSTFYPTV